ncbi:MAG: hypothetical protein PPP58_03825 [Natronomonas sp.]
MSLFGVNRRRALLILAPSTGIVLVTWALHRRYPTLVPDFVVYGVVLAFMSAIIFAGIRDWVKAGQNNSPQWFTHAVDSLGRKHVLGYQYGTVDSSSARFFRAPPTWADIEEEYVVEHPALQSVSDDITSHRGGLVLVEGPPASGKSSLLFAVAYEILTDARIRAPPVYVLELQTTRPSFDQLRADLDQLPNNAILLVDDVHLKPRDLVELANTAKNSATTFVYATRPTRNYPRDLDHRLNDLAGAKHTLEASDVAAEIIDRFLETLDVSPAEKERATDRCMQYRHDLYALDAALRTYETEGEVSDREIHRWITDEMLADDEYGDVYVDRGPLVIAIACLYRFEVAVTLNYLVSHLGLPEENVHALVGAGEILITNEDKYALHHSSIAELIIDAAHGPARHDIPQTFRRPDGDLDWPAKAVLSYIDAEPHLAVEILAEIASTQAEGRRLASTLLTELDPSILAGGIDANHITVDDLGSVLYLYLGHEIDPPPAVVDAVTEFAPDCETTDPAAWAWTTNVLARLDVSAASTFGTHLTPLLDGAEPELIADSLTGISYGSPELSREISAGIDPGEVGDRLAEREISPVKMAMIIAKLVWVDPDRFDRIATRFAPLLLDIDAEEFPAVLCRVAWGNQRSAKRMLLALPEEELSSYLEDIADPVVYYRALAAMYVVAPTFAQNLSIEVSTATDDTFLEASERLLAVDAETPVEGLQRHVSGPAHDADPSAPGVAADLFECESRPPERRDETLESIAAAASPAACLVGLFSLPETTVSAIGRDRLAAWVADEVDTTALPAAAVDAASTLLDRQTADLEAKQESSY